jgi:glyoxylase-like metal-dependent hydrolase (beta-lactamase superfamily II)
VTDPRLIPPVDPRSAWELPPFGVMATVEDLDEVTARVLAPNPSPMTLDGTNTYILGEPDSGTVAVVDPGPDDPTHLDRVQGVIRDRDAEVAAVLVTHHHHDHTEAARAWARTFGCRVHAPRPEDAGPDGVVLVDGATVDLPDLPVQVVATPGHTRDHVAFRLPNGSVLTGDHVLGRGTSVVAHPDGDLVSYLDSLRRVLDLGPDALHPGHGPSMVDDPTAVLEYYAAHRRFRRAQVLAALEAGPASPRQLVEDIYRDVDPRLWGAAELSTRALLAALVADQTVVHDAADRVRLVGR